MNQTELVKEKLELEYRIKKIDNILDGEENLERYLEILENNKLQAPMKLNEEILKRLPIKSQERKEEKEEVKKDVKKIQFAKEKIKQDDTMIKRIQYKFTDMMKIVACTVFALAIWQLTLTNDTYAKKSNDINIKQEEKENKIEMKRVVNDFFMNPIKIERGNE